MPLTFIVKISSGSFVAVSAYEDRLALFSISSSAGSNIIDKVKFPFLWKMFHFGFNVYEACSGLQCFVYLICYSTYFTF